VGKGQKVTGRPQMAADKVLSQSATHKNNNKDQRVGVATALLWAVVGWWGGNLDNAENAAYFGASLRYTMRNMHWKLEKFVGGTSLPRGRV